MSLPVLILCLHIRMDIDQSARRQARDEFQVIDPDYYDMEGMIKRYNLNTIDLMFLLNSACLFR